MHIMRFRLFLITLFKDFKGRGLLKLYWDFCIPQLGSRIDVITKAYEYNNTLIAAGDFNYKNIEWENEFVYLGW